MKINDRRFYIVLQVLFWTVMFLQYILLAQENEKILEPKGLTMRLMRPVSYFIIFYLNFLWLAKGCFLKKQYRAFYAINLVAILLLAFGIEIGHNIVDQNNSMHDHGVPPLQIVLLFMLKNILSLVVFAALATMIQSSLTIHSMHDTVQEIDKKKAEAHLMLLQAQTRPHFLLNTLNNIYALIAFDQAKAQRAVMSLSGLLRQMLYVNSNKAVNIKGEVEFLDNYVKLMKLRLPKNVRVDFRTEIPELSDNIMIAPFIIISLIENAFKHGVSPTEPSSINISINATAERIVCDIRNSNFPKNDNDRSGHGIGLKLVESRLKLYYEGNYSWEKGTENREYKSIITIYDTKLCNYR